MKTLNKAIFVIAAIYTLAGCSKFNLGKEQKPETENPVVNEHAAPVENGLEKHDSEVIDSKGAQEHDVHAAAPKADQKKSSVKTTKNSKNSNLPTITLKDKKENKQTVQHTVKERETLWFLAQLYYGSGADHEKILKDNRMSSPQEVKAGQVLNLINVIHQPKSAGFQDRYDRLWKEREEKLAARKSQSGQHSVTEEKEIEKQKQQGKQTKSVNGEALKAIDEIAKKAAAKQHARPDRQAHEELEGR